MGESTNISVNEYIHYIQKNIPWNQYIELLKANDLNELLIKWGYFYYLNKEWEYKLNWEIKKYRLPKQKLIDKWYFILKNKIGKEWKEYIQVLITRKWIILLNEEIKKRILKL